MEYCRLEGNDNVVFLFLPLKKYLETSTCKGHDDRPHLEALATQAKLGASLARLHAVITRDHETFRGISGVRSAGTAVAEHHVCAQCKATKRDILEGEPFAVWKEQLHSTDLFPEVPVLMRCECPLHGTRILASQLMKHTCHTLRACSLSARQVMELKTRVGLGTWDEATNLEHTAARELLSHKQRFSYCFRSI